MVASFKWVAVSQLPVMQCSYSKKILKKESIAIHGELKYKKVQKRRCVHVCVCVWKQIDNEGWRMKRAKQCRKAGLSLLHWLLQGLWLYRSCRIGSILKLMGIPESLMIIQRNLDNEQKSKKQIWRNRIVPNREGIETKMHIISASV